MINEVLRAVQMGSLPWVEKYGGIARIEDIYFEDQGVLKYPIAHNVEGYQVHEQGRYKDLEPGGGSSSVLYFEQVGNAIEKPYIKKGTNRFNKIIMSVPLRLIAWVDLAALGVSSSSVSYQMIADVMAHLKRSENLPLPVGSPLENKVFQIKADGIAIEPKTTTRELFRRFGFGGDQELYFYPYDYFSILFNLTWQTPLDCNTQFTPGTELNCIDMS
jgi:hypothetical protein